MEILFNRQKNNNHKVPWWRTIIYPPYFWKKKLVGEFFVNFFITLEKVSLNYIGRWLAPQSYGRYRPQTRLGLPAGFKHREKNYIFLSEPCHTLLSLKNLICVTFIIPFCKFKSKKWYYTQFIVILKANLKTSV